VRSDVFPRQPRTESDETRTAPAIAIPRSSQALFVAQRLRRASADTAPETRDAFMAFWRSHGRRYFRCEEEVLLPAYAEHGDPRHPLVARVLTDQVDMRWRAAQIERGPQNALPALKELGAQLAHHVRLEERELFPLIEQALEPAELERLAAALEEAESYRERDGHLTDADAASARRRSSRSARAAARPAPRRHPAARRCERAGSSCLSRV
jgi:hypothetical protein